MTSDCIPSISPVASKLGSSHAWSLSPKMSSSWLASTRLSNTPFGLPGDGIRRIVSGTFL